jgi:hypothetical protein
MGIDVANRCLGQIVVGNQPSTCLPCRCGVGGHLTRASAETILTYLPLLHPAAHPTGECNLSRLVPGPGLSGSWGPRSSSKAEDGRGSASVLHIIVATSPDELLVVYSYMDSGLDGPWP